MLVGDAMTPANYGLWAEYSGSADTFGAALRRIVATIDLHQTGSRMSLRPMPDHVVWGFHPQTAAPTGKHYADHTVGPMRHFAASYLGTDWTPSWIELNYAKDHAARELAHFWHCDVRFEAPAIGLAIPLELLSTRKPASNAGRPRPHITSVELLANARRRRGADSLHTIQDIMTLRLLDGAADIEGAARLAGMSVRSLQRLLGEKGSSYRDLLDLTRHRRATALLTETDTSIIEIAMMLGYNEPANFTRAFQRWSGYPPSDLRRFRAQAVA